jgi:4-hydroxy-tetrahydrodipicolinate reductase
MGTEIAAQAVLDGNWVIAGRVDESVRELPELSENIVVVDFSSESGTKSAQSIAYELRAPLFVGTTGLSEETLDGLRELAREVPVAVAPNTSLGVAALRYLVGVTCRLLGTDGEWSAELVEKHHIGKKDAPSGTAIDLATSCTDGGIELPQAEISSIRDGDAIGEHEVRFTSDHETLILRHVALDRVLFARGALRLCRSLAARPPGLYEVADLLDPMNG